MIIKNNAEITEKIKSMRDEVRVQYGQSVLDEMDDGEIIVYALGFLHSNIYDLVDEDQP